MLDVYRALCADGLESDDVCPKEYFRHYDFASGDIMREFDGALRGDFRFARFSPRTGRHDTTFECALHCYSGLMAMHDFLPGRRFQRF